MYLSFHFWTTLILIACAVGAILGTCAYLILAERKISAWAQDRLGPNRVGPWGVLQPIADGLKFLLKEEIIPGHVDRLFYLLGPAIALSTALLAFAPHVDIGILFIFAVGSLAVYAIILGGWSSNNKYSLLGSLRSSAQIISYEIPLGTSVLAVLLYAGSLNLERVVASQVGPGGIGWYIVYQPLTFLLFLVAVFAECNRLPFDLPEAEQELVGGYHTEYSALKFGLFFLGEYTHIITTSLLLSVLFLGGWHFPWIAEADSGILPKLLVIWAKAIGFIVLYMLLRWTIPRF